MTLPFDWWCISPVSNSATRAANAIRIPASHSRWGARTVKLLLQPFRLITALDVNIPGRSPLPSYRSCPVPFGGLSDNLDASTVVATVFPHIRRIT